MRKAAYKMVSKECETVAVHSSNLNDFVGKALFLKDRMYEVTPAGK